MNSRLVIVDRSLTDERGHHFALTKVVTEGALAHGLRVIWYTNTAFSATLAMEGVRARGVFSHSTYERFRKPGSGEHPSPRTGGGALSALGEILIRVRNSIVYRVTKAFGRSPLDLAAPQAAPTPAAGADSSTAAMSKALAAALEADGIGPHDHVLVHTTDGDMYRVVLHLALNGDLEGAMPGIHLVTPYDAGTMPHYNTGLAVDRVVRYMSLLNIVGSKIFLYAEHDGLARDLAARWSASVHSLPIPPPTEALEEPVDDDRPLTIAYMGAAREEKGFLLLPDIVERCRSDHGSKLRFVIQCSPQIVGYTAKIEAAIERLGVHPEAYVKLIPQGQSMSDYYAVLRDADVVLACYDRDKYKVRGSGIAVEAVVFGDTLIASPETSPAEIAGRAAVTAGSVDEIVSRITEILHNRTEFARTARECRAAYIEDNSASAYVAKLLSRSPDPAIEARRESVRRATAGRATRGTDQTKQDWREELSRIMAQSSGESRTTSTRLLGRG